MAKKIDGAARADRASDAKQLPLCDLRATICNRMKNNTKISTQARARSAARGKARQGVRSKVVALALLGAAAGGAGCVSILGDFGDEEVAATGGGGPPASASKSSSAGPGSGGAGGGSTTGAGGGAGGAGGGQAGCPDLGRGPTMVHVPGPNGVNYCVDSTEVSIAQYDAWLSTTPDPGVQSDLCKPWNMSFEVAPSGNYCELFNYAMALANVPDRPILCVDWCDASAFCAWAGKRLCGKIGGGSNDFGSPTDPTASQWYRACSEAGARDFPYGDQYDPAACVGVEFDGDATFDGTKDYPHDVGSVPTCEGGYAGIFDMSGNVWEWEDSCNGSAGKTDGCQTRSGAFGDLEQAITCFNASGRSRDTSAIYLGFRCCADL
jgi:formylglycine-generating enzyme